MLACYVQLDEHLLSKKLKWKYIGLFFQLNNTKNHAFPTLLYIMCSKLIKYNNEGSLINHNLYIFQGQEIWQ